jgi:RNA polymerase sigma factor (sigma-70 family)
MARTRLQPIASYLHLLAGARDAPAADDARLLERYVAERDARAFAALVRRHGALVWRVCRRTLHNLQDAEDAFQATFLLLARRAGSIRRPAALASWLHGVAYRVATKARQRAQRPPPCQEERAAPPSLDPCRQAACRELEQIVEAEMQRLPEKYRLVLLLCYWEGQTCEEAARRLDCPCGTIKTRLTRARQLLHARLVRRGVTLSAGVVSMLLAPGADAAAPAPLIGATARLAQAALAGHVAAGGVSSRVASLMEGTLPGLAAKLRLALLVVLVAGLLIAGAGFVAQEPPTAVTASPLLPSELQTRPEAPARQPAPSERLRIPQPGGAVAVELSPDGTVLATYGGSPPPYRLELWDTVTGELLGKREVNGQGINSRPLAFAPNGNLLVVEFGAPPRIIECDPVTAKQVRTLSLPEPQGGVGPILLRCSADGKRLAVAVEADRALVLDAATGKRVQEAANPSRFTIFSLDFSPDRKTLALGTGGPSLQLWHLETGKRLLGLEERPEDRIVASLAFSPDGKLLAAGRGNRIIVSETASGRERALLEAPMRLVNGLAFAGDDMLVSASHDGKARIWDVRSRRVQHTLDGGAEGRSLALTVDHSAVALGTTRHAIIWDGPLGQRVPRPKNTSLPAADRERLWPALAGDAAEAHEAVRKMVAAPEETLALLRRHLQAIPEPGPQVKEQIRRRIAELDSESFPQREIATRQLEMLGSQAEAALRQALVGRPSLEARRRIERILKKIGQQGLQPWRALKIAEHIGTPPARQLLKRLASGPAEAHLTREAQGALERLARRSPAAPR